MYFGFVRVRQRFIVESSKLTMEFRILAFDIEELFRRYVGIIGLFMRRCKGLRASSK